MSVAIWWRPPPYTPTTSIEDLPSMGEIPIFQLLRKRRTDGLCMSAKTLPVILSMWAVRLMYALDGPKQRKPVWTATVTTLDFTSTSWMDVLGTLEVVTWDTSEGPWWPTWTLLTIGWPLLGMWGEQNVDALNVKN